jgi:multisubunit Na+/H+ antiporter MnhB subunit
VVWYNSNGAERSTAEERSLNTALAYAQKGYDNHTDWFQRHRDSAVKQLGLILSAELIVLRFFDTLGHVAILGGSALILLAMVSILLSIAGIKSCSRA